MLVVIRDISKKEKVMEMLRSRVGVMWLETCDEALLRHVNNGARSMMRSLSRSMELVVSEMTGGSTRNYSNNSMLFLARTVTEQFMIVDVNLCSNLFREYSGDSILAITVIDPDSSLIVIVLTMLSDKNSLFQNMEWRVIGNCAGYNVYWPEMNRLRR